MWSFKCFIYVLNLDISEGSSKARAALGLDDKLLLTIPTHLYRMVHL